MSAGDAADTDRTALSGAELLQSAYDYCTKIAHRHGANFSVGFRFLPPVKRRAVYAAYAWCRRADDIADEDPQPGEDATATLQRLNEWQRELDRCYEGNPGNPITIALQDSLRSFAIPKSAFVALLDGCRQDLEKNRYENFSELSGYCEMVATSISDISLAIFGYRSDQALTHGRNLSTALQLTNIIRDVGDDLERDRIYLPLDEMRRFNVTEAMLVSRTESPEFRALMQFQIERAEKYFRDAQPLLRELDFDARFPTLLMGAVYSRVLFKIKRDIYAPLHRRTSLSFPQKVGVVLRSLARARFV